MMERLDSQKSPKRSPLDLIMNQIRRKKSFSERLQKPSVSRFFRPFESEDRKESGVSEEGEDKEDVPPGTGESESLETETGSVVGWGRVRQFVQKMGRQPDSQNLSLSHCDLTATDVVELATLLPFLSSLDEMDLSWNDLIGGSLKALTFHLQHVCRLRALRLSGCRLSPQDLAALGETLEELPLLEVLDLSWNAGLGGHLQLLATQLRSGCRLKELHLVDCGLTAADVGAVGAMLSRLTGLELLDLSTNQLLGGAFGDLVPQLQDAPGLRVLRLRGCGLGTKDLEMLGGVLQFLPTLQELDLSCNRGVSGGLAHLGAQLGGLAQLCCLDVHDCCLTEEDVQVLVQALPSLSDITMLDLSSNKMLGGVTQQLFAGFPLGNVKRLNLSSCCLTEETYLALAMAVHCLPLLEALNLSWNKCVGGKLNSLLEALPTSAALLEMRLSSCGLTAEDVLQLASLANRQALSHLRQLDLSYNGGVGGAGWLPLFQSLGSLVALTELDVSLRPSDAAPASAWLSALLNATPRPPALQVAALRHWSLTPHDKNMIDIFCKDAGKSIFLDYDP
ncbi:LOW QUALITY PROTEIN: leucine-rich repeat-containing protein 31-like [Brienomyrus brachyistius]|uniref:LOW QUALITY PROTEIN: leucine-rich repeat-containing protein 31-like n=1 Tax=Brienomyrus brachyistius TaxID=42636 RepID=UPI0020B3F09C|nr:LOW QUALITY PROTEIN: leucine-rich repeat-containing protein 31-like [Brienomyrus brachyistius]